MNYIIVDLEATCWEKRAGRKNETIEIGAVCVNENKEITGEFEQFIKPVINPELSGFCTELTSITQAMVEGAPKFPEAMTAFKAWIDQFEDEFCWGSWGRYDKNQFLMDAAIHEMDLEWLQNHISLKHQYTEIKGLSKHVGMKVALIQNGFSLDGLHHRGIDDARNITKLFVKYFDHWKWS